MNPFAGKTGAQRELKTVRHLAPVFPKEWMQPINGQMLPPVWTGGGRGGENFCVHRHACAGYE